MSMYLFFFNISVH